MSDLTSIRKMTVSTEADTAKVAALLAPHLKAQDVVTLNGTLGAGKTAFARALIQCLCGSTIEVPSPTFNLLLTYDSDQGAIYHYDFYRLEDPEEVWELDIEDALHEGITVIEWVERLQELAPEGALSVTLSIPVGRGEETREIEISGGDAWRDRLKGLEQ